MLKANGKQGVPQGGVISPLLSNLYLTEVDRMLERAKEATRYGYGQRVCVVQAKRHIHSPRRRLDFVHAGAPHRHRRLVVHRLERFDPDLLRRRWRTVMGRHPPKNLSQAIMARILMWREQVAEVGDLSPRARAILAEALRGKDDRGDVVGGPADRVSRDGIASSQDSPDRDRAGPRAWRRPPSRHRHAGWLRMEGANVPQPVRRSARHYGRQLERTPILRRRP